MLDPTVDATPTPRSAVPRATALAPARNKVLELESIRGIAALLVVLFHLPPWNATLFSIGFIRNSDRMVDLFFVLSGYVIYTAYGHRIRNVADLLRFQFLRFGRIYPVHLAFLLVGLAIEIAKNFAASRLGLAHANLAGSHGIEWTAFIQQLFLVQAIGPTGNEGTFNPPAWSISVEFYTYVIFAVIVLLAGRFKLIAFACLGALSFGLLLPGHDALGFGNLLMCTTGFSLGCLTASLTQHRKLDLPAYAPLLALLLLAAYLQFKAVGSLDLLIFPLSSLVIIAVVYARDGVGRIVLTWRPFVWLGMVSYSLYLSHHATIWILGQAFRFIWKRPEVLIGARTVPQLSIFEVLAAYPVFVAASLCVGWLTYKLIEKPFRERSRKIAGVA